MSQAEPHPQLPLGLTLRDNARFESFHTGVNEEAVRTLHACAAGLGEPLVYVAGNTGLGKTHLLQAACHAAAQHQRSAMYLPLRQAAELSPSIFAGFEQTELVCLDDVDVIAGQAEWEQALFDFFNRLRDAGHTLLVTASARADQAGFALPDLVSRLGWGVTFVLKPLDDDTLLAVMMDRARSRGLELPPETAKYILARYPRELNSLFPLFDELDRASLVSQRRLTIPFVKSVLENVTT
jgi:DnaA family protein